MKKCLIKNQFIGRFFYICTLIFIIFTFLISSSSIFNEYITENNQNTLDDKNLKNSGAVWAILDLTNPSEINNSRFLHGTSIPIKGRLYNFISNDSKIGYQVAIEVNDVLDTNFNDVTDNFGEFQIDYTIDLFLDVELDHKICVKVDGSTPGDVIYHHHYMINVNATSDFNIVSHDDTSTPKLTEEYFNLEGYLNYDNSLGIPGASVNYYWIAGPTIISQGSFFTDGSGSLTNLQVPITFASYLTLKFNYSDPPEVDYSEEFITNIKVFSDITWDLDIFYTTTEGVLYTLTGTLYSSTDPSLRISNRDINVYYNGTIVATATTVSDGTFISSFQVPEGNGTASLQVQLDEFVAGKDIYSPIQYILVESAPESLPGGGGLPPFFLFSIIFFPILAGIVAGLAVYGYKYYKKQEQESRVVNIPLESKIKNLKILKDSGRLEESISYLFNAIYMDLIDARYNRIRKENETIRDFAIISVKELKLTPSSIYPFIQKVEEIIYAKPFKITDKDFYGTCELFSPIYFQLTGYNFLLNF